MVRLLSLPLVVMHCDLTGDAESRSVHAALTQEALKAEGIQRLTQSVLAMPQEKGETSTLAAARLWRSVAKLTSGRLVAKDRFYLHYPHGGVTATVVEVIAAGSVSLTAEAGLEKLGAVPR